MPIRIFNSWRESGVVPQGWSTIAPPGHVTKETIHNRAALKALRQCLPGKWVKVYRLGQDGSEVHYFEHSSGKVANVKVKYEGGGQWASW